MRNGNKVVDILDLSLPLSLNHTSGRARHPFRLLRVESRKLRSSACALLSSDWALWDVQWPRGWLRRDMKFQYGTAPPASMSRARLPLFLPRMRRSEAEVVWTCVADTAAVERVIFGDDGALQGSLHEGAIIVDSSTISPPLPCASPNAPTSAACIGWTLP